MSFLTAADIIKAVDINTVTVDVPEWGGTVIVSELTAKASADYQSLIYAYDIETQQVTFNEGVSHREALLSFALVDEEGNRLFDQDGIAALENKNSAVVTRLYEIAKSLNKETEGDEEELAKNS